MLTSFVIFQKHLEIHCEAQWLTDHVATTHCQCVGSPVCGISMSWLEPLFSG